MAEVRDQVSEDWHSHNIITPLVGGEGFVELVKFRVLLGLLVVPVLMLAACSGEVALVGDVSVGFDDASQDVFVSWETDGNTASQVVYGLEGALAESTPEQRGRNHYHVLANVEPGLTYEFRVLMTGEGNELVVVTGGTVDTPNLQSAPWVRTEAGHTRVAVSWGKAFGAATYVVERATGDNDFQAVATVDDVSFVDNDVQSGQTYSYRVRSMDSSGHVAEPSPSVIVTAPANLVKNPSFEEVEGGMPVGWRTHTYGGQAEYMLAEGDGRDGGNAVMTRSAQGVDGNWETSVQLQPDTEYRLSAWVKTENLQANTGLGTVISIHELQDQAGQNGGRTAAIAGSNDWHYVETTFNSGDATLDTPNDTYTVLALMGGWGTSMGTAWYDDFALVPVVVADSRD